MSETALKFGPEWLRALSSHGNNPAAPSISVGAAIVKFKLADFRYGREEMLALYGRYLAPPTEEAALLGSLYVDESQEPLAFLPINEEEALERGDKDRFERRPWQRGLPSEGGMRGNLRLPPGGVMGRGRGGSMDRGRGRARGMGSYYGRGVSYDDEGQELRIGGPPAIARGGKSYERSQSLHEPRPWGERGAPPGVGAPIVGELDEHGGTTSPRKEPGRSGTVSWRSRGGMDPEEGGGERWRGAPPQGGGGGGGRGDTKWGNRGGWRENGTEENWGDNPAGGSGLSTRGQRGGAWDRSEKGSRRSWDEEYLPEWVSENPTGDGRGSFDSAGAFHGSSWEEEDGSKRGAPVHRRNANGDEDEERGEEKENVGLIRSEKERPPLGGQKQNASDGQSARDQPGLPDVITNNASANGPSTGVSRDGGTKIAQSQGAAVVPPHREEPRKAAPQPKGGVAPSASQAPGMARQMPLPPETKGPVVPPKDQSEEPRGVPGRNTESLFLQEKNLRLQEEVNLEFMSTVANDLVDKLVEEDVPAGGVGVSGTGVEEKWFYTDPQGDVQGPFASSDMADWYKAGYFTPNLLLRRECDDKFCALGDLVRVFGRMPFQAGPAIPPLKMTADHIITKNELEQSYQVQNQLYQQQVMMRQQQLLQKLQSHEEWKGLTSLQQQQLFTQQLLTMPMPPPATLPASMLGGSVPNMHDPSRGSPHDPIQALVAQMGVPVAVPAAQLVTDNPLQKLLLQLQRTQGTSNSGTIGPTEKPPEPQFDAIQSLMQQLTKLQQQPMSHELIQGNGSWLDNWADAWLQALPEGGASVPALFPSSGVAPCNLQQGQSGNGGLSPSPHHHLNPPPGTLFWGPLSGVSSESGRDSPSTGGVLGPEMNSEEQRRREDEHRLLEEERRRLEEQKRMEEERVKMEDLRLKEEVKHQEEQRRQLEVLRRQQEEEALRLEEERRRIHEETMRRQEDEKRRQEDQERWKAQQERAETSMRQEEMRREEERRRQEEKSLRELEEEMRRLSCEEERRRMRQIEEQEVKQQALMQERLQQMLPVWNSGGVKETSVAGGGAPSLAEIQRAQEEKERKERDLEMQLQLQRQREAQQRAAAAAAEEQRLRGPKWASGVAPQVVTPKVKSLKEIQAEEEKEMKKRQEKEQAERAVAVKEMSLAAAGVWASHPVSNVSWAGRASAPMSGGSAAPTGVVGQQWPMANGGWNQQGVTSGWSQELPSKSSANPVAPTSQGGGFWDNVDPAPVPPTAKPQGGTKRNTPKGSPKPKGAVGGASNHTSGSSKGGKDETAAVKKIFSDNLSSRTPTDSFTRWCQGALDELQMQSDIDVTTFVTFLSDVESPYEVHDYIRTYLGDTKEVREFARQYLDRRSRARNAEKERRDEDDILAPAPAVNPATQEYQEVKSRNKKTNRKRMQKVDSSFLGFSVTSDDRINVGERDYAE